MSRLILWTLCSNKMPGHQLISQNIKCMLLVAGCYWVRLAKQNVWQKVCIFLVSTQSQRYPKTQFHFGQSSTLLDEDIPQTQKHHLGSSSIVITTSQCKFVKMWMLISRSVVLRYQNSSSTAEKHLSYLDKNYDIFQMTRFNPTMIFFKLTD